MKTIWIVSIAVAVGLLVGGGTYYFVSSKANKDKDALASKLQTTEQNLVDKEKSSQETIEDLSSKLEAKDAPTPATQNPTATQTAPAAKTKVLTHTNELGKFSFELPDGYIVTKTGNCEGRCGEALSVSKLNSGISYSDMAITIRSVEYDSPITLEAWNTETGYSPISQIGEVKIDGVIAKIYNNGGLFEVEDIRFTRGNYTYEITTGGEARGAEQKAAYDKIIFTFKFTN